MAFNITGSATVTNSVPRTAPPAPTNLTVARVSKLLARLTWNFMPSFFTPHAGFKVQYRVQGDMTQGAEDDWETLGAVSPISESGSYNLDINDLPALVEVYEFRVNTLPAPSVRELGVEPTWSNIAELVPEDINIPQMGTVSAGSTLDTCLITWTFTNNFRCISNFVLECRSEGLADIDTNWSVIGTIAANEEASTGSTTYQFIQNGYATEDDNIFYRIKAVDVVGAEGDYSTAFNFSPTVVAEITNFAYVRTGLDVGEFSWVYEGVPVRAFTLEVAEGVDDDFSPVATVDAEIRQYRLMNIANEGVTLRYRIRTVGLNRTVGDPTDQVTIAPITIEPPTSLVGVPNEAVGTVTSVSLAWSAPVERFTRVAGYVIQFRPVSIPADPWQQLTLVSPDRQEAEIIPPQQGPIQFRIGAVGSNGLASDYFEYSNGMVVLDARGEPTIDASLASFEGFTAPANLIISGGSATDDAIYNGDNQYIANPHFSVDSDDKCATEADVDIVEGGVFAGMVGNGDRRIVQNTGETLVVDYRFAVSLNEVRNRRHYYMGLDALGTNASPTTLWRLDTGNVLLEVITDPVNTPAHYLSGNADSQTTYIYTDTTNSTDVDDPTFGLLPAGPVTKTDANTRTYEDRFDARPFGTNFQFGARQRIRLGMRRTFTFRSDGFTCIRLTFLPDVGGGVTIPLPDDPPNSTNSLCLEAFSSEVTETGSVSGVNTAGVPVIFTGEYETVPMITTTPSEACIIYFSNKTTTGATLHALDPAGAITQCDVDYTVRGY